MYQYFHHSYMANGTTDNPNDGSQRTSRTGRIWGNNEDRKSLIIDDNKRTFGRILQSLFQIPIGEGTANSKKNKKQASQSPMVLLHKKKQNGGGDLLLNPSPSRHNTENGHNIEKCGRPIEGAGVGSNGNKTSTVAKCWVEKRKITNAKNSNASTILNKYTNGTTIPKSTTEKNMSKSAVNLNLTSSTKGGGPKEKKLFSPLFNGSNANSNSNNNNANAKSSNEAASDSLENGIKVIAYANSNRTGQGSKVSDLISSHNNKIASAKDPTTAPKIFSSGSGHVATNGGASAVRKGSSVASTTSASGTGSGDKTSTLTSSALKYFDAKSKKGGGQESKAQSGQPSNDAKQVRGGADSGSKLSKMGKSLLNNHVFNNDYFNHSTSPIPKDPEHSSRPKFRDLWNEGNRQNGRDPGMGATEPNEGSPDPKSQPASGTMSPTLGSDSGSDFPDFRTGYFEQFKNREKTVEVPIFREGKGDLDELISIDGVSDDDLIAHKTRLIDIREDDTLVVKPEENPPNMPDLPESGTRQDRDTKWKKSGGNLLIRKIDMPARNKPPTRSYFDPGTYDDSPGESSGMYRDLRSVPEEDVLPYKKADVIPANKNPISTTLDHLTPDPDSTTSISDDLLAFSKLTSNRRRCSSREPPTCLYLDGRKRMVIVITGGTRGLGLAMARKLCRLVYGFEGDVGGDDEASGPNSVWSEMASKADDIASCRFDIILTGRDERHGSRVVSDLQYKVESALRARDRERDSKGSSSSTLPLPQVNLVFQHLDVSDLESITRFSDHLTRSHGAIDILINNAATCLESNAAAASSSSTFQRSADNGTGRSNGLRRSYRRESINKHQECPLAKASASPQRTDQPYGQLFEDWSAIAEGKPSNGYFSNDHSSIVSSEDSFLDLSSTHSITSDAAVPDDSTVAEITLRTNFWGIINLYTALCPLFRTHCRVVNVTCSAGTPRNCIKAEVRSRLMKTVNHVNHVNERHSEPSGGSTTPNNSTTATTSDSNSSWFSSNYFNLNFYKQQQQQLPSVQQQRKGEVTKGGGGYESLEELEDLIESYLRATKAGTRAREGWCGSHYSISKMAVTALTAIQQSILDRASSGTEDIVINACCPGYIKTTLNGSKGYLSVDEGSETPIFLALLPPNVPSPRGNFVCQKRIKEWT